MSSSSTTAAPSLLLSAGLFSRAASMLEESARRRMATRRDVPPPPPPDLTERESGRSPSSAPPPPPQNNRRIMSPAGPTPSYGISPYETSPPRIRTEAALLIDSPEGPPFTAHTYRVPSTRVMVTKATQVVERPVSRTPSPVKKQQVQKEKELSTTSYVQQQQQRKPPVPTVPHHKKKKAAAPALPPPPPPPPQPQRAWVSPIKKSTPPRPSPQKSPRVARKAAVPDAARGTVRHPLPVSAAMIPAPSLARYEPIPRSEWRPSTPPGRQRSPPKFQTPKVVGVPLAPPPPQPPIAHIPRRRRSPRTTRPSPSPETTTTKPHPTKYAYTKHHMSQHARRIRVHKDGGTSETPPPPPVPVPPPKKQMASPLRIPIVDAAADACHRLITSLIVTDTQRQGCDMGLWAGFVRHLSLLPHGIYTLLQQRESFSSPFKTAVITLLLNTPCVFREIVLPILLQPMPPTEDSVVCLLGFHDMLPAPVDLSRHILRTVEVDGIHDTTRQTCCLAVRCLGGVALLKTFAHSHRDPNVRKHAIASLAHVQLPRPVVACARPNDQQPSFTTETTPDAVRSLVSVDKAIEKMLALGSTFPEISERDILVSMEHITACASVLGTCVPFLPLVVSSPKTPSSSLLTQTHAYSPPTTEAIAAFFCEALSTETHEDVLTQLTLAMSALPVAATERCLMRMASDNRQGPPHHHTVFTLAHAVTRLGATPSMRAGVLDYLLRCIPNQMLTREVRAAAVVGLRAFGAEAFLGSSQYILNAMYDGAVAPSVAMTTLSGMGHAALTLLTQVAVMESMQSEYRTAAIHAMQAVVSPTQHTDCILTLRRLLHDSLPNVRAEAATTLSFVCQDDPTQWANLLSQLLADSEAEVREAAATGLAMYGGHGGVEVLMECLGCGFSSGMRREAARALAFTVGGQPLLALLRGLRDLDPEVAGASADSLMGMSLPATVEGVLRGPEGAMESVVGSLKAAVGALHADGDGGHGQLAGTLCALLAALQDQPVSF